MSAVETFKSNVNKTIQTAVDNTIIRGLYRFCDHNDPPRMTGKTGKTHGARTLSIPAKNEIRSSDIRENSENKLLSNQYM